MTDAGPEKPKKKPSGWQRFLNQKTAPQRLLVAVAAIATSLTAIGGAIYALTRVVGGSDPPAQVSTTGGTDATTTTRPPSSAPSGRTVVRQQSPEADQLVRDLVAAAGSTRMIRLDHLIYEQAGRVIFTDSDLRLVYNCGSALGCDLVRLQFPRGLENRPRVVEDGQAAEFLGQYTVQLTRGIDFGDESLDIAFTYLGA